MLDESIRPTSGANRGPRLAGAIRQKPDPTVRRRKADLAAELQRAHLELVQKDALLHEADHRMKNSFQLSASVLRLQAERSSNAETREHLLVAHNRLLALASTHAALQGHSATGHIRLDDHLARLCAALAAEAGVVVHLRCEPVTCLAKRAAFVALAAEEAITNAMRHAFPDGRRGQIWIDVRRLDDGLLELSVRDDGVGMAPSRREGFGSRLMSSFCRSLDGVLRHPAGVGSGTGIALRFPPDPADTVGRAGRRSGRDGAKATVLDVSYNSEPAMGAGVSANPC